MECQRKNTTVNQTVRHRLEDGEDDEEVNKLEARTKGRAETQSHYMIEYPYNTVRREIPLTRDIPRWHGRVLVNVDHTTCDTGICITLC